MAASEHNFTVTYWFGSFKANLTNRRHQFPFEDLLIDREVELLVVYRKQRLTLFVVSLEIKHCVLEEQRVAASTCGRYELNKIPTVPFVVGEEYILREFIQGQASQ